MTAVKIFVSVRDRYRQTVACVDSLSATTAGKADICIYDNGSEAEFEPLQKAYRGWLASWKVSQVVLNRPDLLSGVYWSKNFAWAQFLAMMELLPPSEREYLVMADNDIVAKPGWLEASLKILGKAESDIAVVSPYDGPPDPKSNPEIFHVLEEAVIQGHRIEIRDACCSRLWVAPYRFWRRWPPPTHERIERDGKPDRMPTDWYYWTKMREARLRFAVLTPPLAHNPQHSWSSARMGNGIGADCKGEKSTSPSLKPGSL